MLSVILSLGLFESFVYRLEVVMVYGLDDRETRLVGVVRKEAAEVVANGNFLFYYYFFLVGFQLEGEKIRIGRGERTWC